MQATVSIWRQRWRRLRQDRAAVAGGGALLILLVACCFAGLAETWFGVSGVRTDLVHRLQPPSAAHLLGTDDAGRDELARLLRGGWTSLTIGLAGALGASVIGTVLGSISGYMRGRTDAVLMRLTDFVIAVPQLPLLIILASLDLTKLGLSPSLIRSGAAGYWRIVLIVTVLGWTGVARLVRASTLALAQRAFVIAPRAQGAAAWWVLGVHILPNAITPIIVATTVAMGRIILAESGLSFLGIGIQPPATSWGSMLSNAQELIGIAPRLAVLPGMLILLTVVSINFLGDGLQSAFDPRSSQRQ